MHNLLRRAIPDLALAVAAGFLVIMIAGLRDQLGLGVVLGILAAIAVSTCGPLARVGSRPMLITAQLPGHPDAVSRVSPAVVRTGAGLVVILFGLAAASGDAFLMLLGLPIGLIMLADLLIMIWRWVRTGGNRAAVAKAVAAYRPRFVLYSSRERGGDYQLALWLPLLDQLGERYLVVVRHPLALGGARRLTDAPIVCAPLAADLDAVVTDSIRAAFYVNTVGGNANFVGYRSMRHIYLGHGDSDKEASAHPAHAMFDKIFVAGPAARERYARAGVHIPDDRFVVIGRPQLAGIAVADRAIAEINPPTVLVAPTWGGYNNRTDLSSLPACASLVEQLIRRRATVTFRPHPLSWQSAAERSQIKRVDTLLAQDRKANGRAHRLAIEQRQATLVEACNASDALITDVSGVLVDYLATGKPYAVVLGDDAEPPGTAVAAYLITRDRLRGDGTDHLLDQLLRTDPNAERRPEVASRYLGDLPPATEPFLDAVRALLDVPDCRP